MNPMWAFVLGLLAGWLIEWVIDWVFWRQRYASRRALADEACRKRIDELEQEVLSYRVQLEGLKAERERADVAIAQSVADATPVQKREALEEIPGVSAEAARRLNQAGVYTFADLGRLRPPQVREIIAGAIDRPGREVDIVRQARLNAGMIRKVDNLELIDGIGPVIARMLNNAGIFTFGELASLSPEDLRELVGERIQRLADEEAILAQARQFAEQD